MSIKDKDLVYQVSIQTIILNSILVIIKILSGVFAHSSAMISDGIHSLSDVGTTIIVMLGFKISQKKADHNHRYGHEKFEAIASIILSLILFLTATAIGKSGFEKILFHREEQIIVPGSINIVVAIISILFNEYMFSYTKKASNKINSTSLMADAWHHRSDSLSSIGSLLAVTFSILGYPIFDPLASILICFMILKAAFDIFKDAIDQLVDKSCDDEVVNEMIKTVLSVNGVKAVDDIKTRKFAAKAYVDIEISVDHNLNIEEAHNIAEEVHDTIEKEYIFVKHCMVHVNPDKH